MEQLLWMIYLRIICPSLPNEFGWNMFAHVVDMPKVLYLALFPSLDLTMCSFDNILRIFTTAYPR